MPIVDNFGLSANSYISQLATSVGILSELHRQEMSGVLFMYYLSIKGGKYDTDGIAMKELKLTLLGLKGMDILASLLSNITKSYFKSQSTNHMMLHVLH